MDATGAVCRRPWPAVVFFLVATVSVLLGETLKIATYNVENYVSTDRMTDEGYRKDYPKPEAQKSALREVIKRLDVDVLVLQEMGAQAYLDELRRDLFHDGINYPHTVLLSGPDGDRHVAVLAKRPFVSVIPQTELSFRYFDGTAMVKRGVIEVRVDTSEGELTLFGVHLKSRFTDRADDPQSAVRRAGEAVAVRDHVLKRYPNPGQSRFLILGDMNDDKKSKTLDRLRRRGSTAIAELLPIADSRGETWTHVYRKEDSYSRVDHILYSPGLAAAIEAGAGRIEDGPGVAVASDHRPVSNTLRFLDKK